ncbi:MAG: ORF6N domain-containing protein [Undibacterium sp.]|nr:ORF6N domain-containing protein [Opitutaceae bacterium]
MAKKAPDPELPKIHAVCRPKVVPDAHLAKLDGVPTRQLHQAISRNPGKFPEDFCFLPRAQEADSLRTQTAGLKSENDQTPNLRSQVATSKMNVGCEPNLKSQTVTSSLAHGGRRKPVRVFTGHGALMAANVLRSEQAVQMSLYLIRALAALREQLVSNLSTLRRPPEIDNKLLEHDVVLREVLERLQPLPNPPPAPRKPPIGFHPGNR